MKNFSTAVLALALASAFTASQAADAPASPHCAFLPNAPDQHVVTRGDTLWDISGKFLQHAWCWPEVWGLNKDEIRNPHWIYPGQVVYFDRAAGRLRLGNAVGANASNGAVPVVRLGPQVRTERVGGDAVPSIPSNAIEPFLSQPLLVERDALSDAPRIVATQEGRVNIGKDDQAYVRGELHDSKSFQVFRPGVALKDPETGRVLAYEAAYLGTLKLQRPAKEANEAHVFTVVESKQEIGVGDRLVPTPPTPILNYMPHAPEKAINGRIISIYGGVKQAGQNQIVSINRGSKDGIDLGTVLDIARYGGFVADRTSKSSAWSRTPKVKLPDYSYGSLFIFRVFDSVSYGLVMQVKEPVQIGDAARSPE